MAGQGGPHPNKATLSAYADHELPAAERAPVERHLAECSECRAVVAQYHGASDLFQRLPARRAPMSLNRDMWRRIAAADERHRRHRWLPFPLPGANALGLALVALLFVVVARQMTTAFSAFALNRGDDARLAAPVATEIPVVSPSLSDPSTVVPTAAPPIVATTAVATSAGSTGGAPATLTPVNTAAPTGSAGAAQSRVVAGQIAAVNRTQRTITVAEAGAKSWSFGISPGTLFVRKDGQPLGFEDVGLGDQVEVTGVQAAPASGAPAGGISSTGTLAASQVKVIASAALANQAPRVLVLLDGAGALRAPEYGFTGDWIKRLNDTGYAVTAKDPSTVTSAAGLKGFDLVVIGYPATLTNGAVQAVKASKLPVLLGEPRLVQPLGLGQNMDPAQPARRVAGKSVDIPPQAGLVTHGFSGETQVANDTVYRTPIVANGTVLATIADGGQKLTVWSATGSAMYFGFWNSNTGQNHNATYWTLFDRSVLYLLDKDPLGSATAAPATLTK